MLEDQKDLTLINIDEISRYVAIKEGWDENQRSNILNQYENFLESSLKKQTRPSKEVDKLWHEHILNTIVYEEYCLDRFGVLIHHIPCIENELISALSREIGRRIIPLDQYAGPEEIRNQESFLANCSGGAPPVRLDPNPTKPYDKGHEFELANCGAGKPAEQSPRSQIPA